MKKTRSIHRISATSQLLGAMLGMALFFSQSAFGSSVLTAGSNTATTGSVSDQDIFDSESEHTESSSTASFGVLHAYSAAAVTPEAFNIATFGSASFRDDWMIDAPTLSGTAGTVTVRFMIAGTLSAVTQGTPNYSFQTNSTYAQASYIFGANNPTSATKTQRLYGNGTTFGDSFLGIEQTFVLNFTFGQLLEDVKLQISTGASASGFAGFSSSVAADLSHTATWGGFAEVRDASNNLVTTYSFSSGSGVDYTQPVQAVPEPGTAALLAAGSLLFTIIRRRRI